MDFELEENLKILIQKGEITNAIELIEQELAIYVETDFPKMIGKNLLHQIPMFEKYLKTFIQDLEQRISLKLIYGEMNGTINYDEWYLNFFGFNSIGSTDDLSWLADYEDENESMVEFGIKGLEEIQKVYEIHHKNKMYQFDRHEKASDICEHLIVLRIQELLKATIEKNKIDNQEWANTTILITAHDDELIYRVN